MARTNHTCVRVTETERDRIVARQKAAGCRSISLWLRKAALEGVCVNLVLPEVPELIRQLQSCADLVNPSLPGADQAAACGEKLERLRVRLANIRDLQKELLSSLASLRSREKRTRTREKRQARLRCRLADEELAQIERKRRQAGNPRISAFLRKMALDGCIVSLDLTELRTLTLRLRTCTDSVTRFLLVADPAGISPKEKEDLRSCLDVLWSLHREILYSLASIQ